MARTRVLSRQTAVVRPARRQADWSQGPGGVAATALTASGSALMGTGAQALEINTLVRTRGHALLYLTAATSTNDGFDGAIGICVVRSEAFAAGITAVPTPITDVDRNIWLWHQFFSLHGASATIDDALGSTTQRFEVDSKAMRKINVGDTITAVVEATEVGASSLQIRFNTRILVKLT